MVWSKFFTRWRSNHDGRVAARRGLAQGEQDPLVDGEADIPAQQVDEQELAEVQL